MCCSVSAMSVPVFCVSAAFDMHDSEDAGDASRAAATLTAPSYAFSIHPPNAQHALGLTLNATAELTRHTLHHQHDDAKRNNTPQLSITSSTM